LGNLDEAFSLVKKGIEQNPNEQQIRREYDNLQILISYRASLDKHIREEEFADALRKINALLERCDMDTQLIEVKIDILCRSNDVKAAKIFLREKETLLRNISEETYCLNAAKIDRYSNDLGNAKTNLQKAILLNPNSAAVKAELALVKSLEDVKKKASDAFSVKRFDEAIKFYDEACSLDSKNKVWNSVMLSNKASCLMQLKKNREALVEMKKSTDLDPTNAKFMYKRGKLEKDLGEWENAESSMRKAKTLDPSLTIDNDLKEVTKKVKELNKKDYYAILGVDKKASTDQIKKAYKDLVKKWHPDKHAGNKEQQEKAEKKFKEISEAYNVISDPEKRKRYDMGGMDEDQETFTGFQSSNNVFARGGADPIIQMFFNSGSQNSFSFGGAGRGRNGASGPSPFGFQNFFMRNDMDDIFHHFRKHQ